MTDNSERTIRLISPLSVKVWDGEIDSFDYTDVPTSAARPYADEINDAIEKSLVYKERPVELMDYYHGPESVKDKVKSLTPYVDFVNGELMGVCDMVVREKLTPEELDVIKDYLTGQYSDGWGEGFEQRPINTGDGEMYISFWHSGDSFSIKTEQELMPSRPLANMNRQTQVRHKSHKPHDRSR